MRHTVGSKLIVEALAALRDLDSTQTPQSHKVELLESSFCRNYVFYCSQIRRNSYGGGGPWDIRSPVQEGVEVWMEMGSRSSAGLDGEASNFA